MHQRDSVENFGLLRENNTPGMVGGTTMKNLTVHPAIVFCVSKRYDCFIWKENWKHKIPPILHGTLLKVTHF